MNIADCPDRDLLNSHLLGKISDPRAETLDSHLATCDLCLQVARVLQAEDEFTEAMRAEKPECNVTQAEFVTLIERGKQLRSETETVESQETHTVGIVSPQRKRDERHDGQLDQSTDLDPADFLQPAELTDEIGRLGGYRVLEVLGLGGMGLVFRAEDPNLKRLVALKVMKPALAASPSAKNRFLREAQAAAAIDHENIVTIHQVGEDHNVPFIAMQFLRGESLQSWVKREGQLSQSQVARIGREVAVGLAAAHEQDLIHRDIKPDNIWIEAETGRAKILDFGLVRSVRDDAGLTQTGMVLGTPRYMSPEQAQGEEVSNRSDLFSLGSVLYHLVSGKPPFDGSNLTATLLKVAQVDYLPIEEAFPELHSDFAQLISQLLSKNPDKRPATAGVVAQSLKAIEESLNFVQSAENGNSPSWSETETTDLPRPADGPLAARSWRVVGVAALLLLGVGVSWFLFSMIDFGLSPIASTTNGVEMPSPANSRYRGKIDILVERTIDGDTRLLRLNDPGALPLQQSDKFRIEGEVTPSSYLYVVWVDPNHDVTPVYPWDPTIGWNSRPDVEQPSGTISLPPNSGQRYTAPDAMQGVGTMVLFACSTPLEVPDDEVRRWFEELPELELPAGNEHAAVWFDDYIEVRDPMRLRSFEVVGSSDPLAKWQGKLQEMIGDRAAFQTAVSFARTGRK